MSLIIAGGWVMVPLLLISIIVLALVIDRSLSYIWNPLILFSLVPKTHR